MSIVYILTNESMPGFIKIGRTETSVLQRMSELDRTSVPLPFQCYYAARVADYVRVEKTLHTAFGDFRVRPSREFFRMDPYKAKVVIELLAEEDVTPRDDSGIDLESQEALEKVSRSSPRFNFAQAGIPIGAVLQYASDPTITSTVHDANNVLFEDQVVSPSRAAMMANSMRGGSAKALQGPIWWLFEGETIASHRARAEFGDA
ncbi:MAG: hypothetical protein RIS08_398 [Actinomycetota bacterium]|jgi:hypothetical protein